MSLPISKVESYPSGYFLPPINLWVMPPISHNEILLIFYDDDVFNYALLDLDNSKVKEVFTSDILFKPPKVKTISWNLATDITLHNFTNANSLLDLYSSLSPDKKDTDILSMYTYVIFTLYKLGDLYGKQN